MPVSRSFTLTDLDPGLRIRRERLLAPAAERSDGLWANTLGMPLKFPFERMYSQQGPQRRCQSQLKLPVQIFTQEVVKQTRPTADAHGSERGLVSSASYRAGDRS